MNSVGKVMTNSPISSSCPANPLWAEPPQEEAPACAYCTEPCTRIFMRVISDIEPTRNYCSLLCWDVTHLQAEAAHSV